MATSGCRSSGRSWRRQAKVKLHNVVCPGRVDLGHDLPGAAGRAVDAPPLVERAARLRVALGRPAPALNEVAAAGGDAAQVVDVARAVTGGAGRQRLGVADVSLGHAAFSG